MSSIVHLNGRYVPRAEAMIPVDDRGFFFGDGVYEVTRVMRGRGFETERHLARLEYGLRELAIDGAPGRDALVEIHERLIAENGLGDRDALIYVQITRGAAPRTHHFPPSSVRPTVFVSASPFSPDLEARRRGATAVTHPDLRWARCDIKSVNLLPNVLAKQYAQERGALEAVLVRDGVVTEGSHTNVFGMLDGVLRTHPGSNQILGGVTRDVVLELARAQGVPVREFPIFTHDLPRVEELFLSGTTTDVTPIIGLDGRPVGAGSPGPVTRALADALGERIDPVE